MLRLLLLRHAKSSWEDPELADFDRPLNERGRAAAAAMGTFMAERGFLPTRILCSAALRARETLALVLPFLNGDLDICVAQRLYDSDAPGYLTAVREYGGTELSLMLIGHNPATEDFAHVLAPVGDAAGLAAMKAKFPTTGLVVIGFDLPQWRDVGPGLGRLISFHTPKTITTGS
jgi:phosphohistidine phosphatase